MNFVHIFLWLLCLHPSAVLADNIAHSPSTADRYSESRKPISIPAAFACARASRHYIFNINGGEAVVKWQHTFDQNEQPEAISIWARGGLENDGSAFVTLTPNKLYYTKAPMRTDEEYGDDSARLQLRLKGISLDDYMSKKSYFTIGKYGGSFDGFMITAKGDVAVIDDGSEVLGARAESIQKGAVELLRQRIKHSGQLVHEIYELRQRRMTETDINEFRQSRMPEISEILPYEVENLREGLCECEGIFPKDVSEVIKDLVNPNRPIYFKDQQGKVRKLEASDLVCLIS